MTLDELIDIQEAGSRACILGLGEQENPYLRADRRPTEDEARISEWLTRVDAWKFGWEAERAAREGSIGKFFRQLITSQA